MIEFSIQQLRQKVRAKLLEEQRILKEQEYKKKLLEEHDFEYPMKTDYNDTILSDTFSTDIEEGDVIKYTDKSDGIERTGIVKAILGSQARVEVNGEIHYCPIPWIEEVNGQKFNDSGSINIGNPENKDNQTSPQRFRKNI